MVIGLRLMLGTSPFTGAVQFGSKALEYKRLFFDRLEFIFRYADSIAVGIASEDEMVETYSTALIEAPV